MSYLFKLHYPVDMRVHAKSQSFGENKLNYAKYGLVGHNGVDWYPIDGGRNHKVYPTDTGVVSKVYIMDLGWGNAVRIRHSWGESIYGHFLNTPLVKLGQSVNLTTALGIEDSTGNSTGTHIHFGVYPNGESTSNGYSGAVDPEKVGFYTYNPYDNNPIGSTPTKPTTPTSPALKAGNASTLPLVGLNLRVSPSALSRSLMRLPFGTVLEITGETKVDGNIVWRVVKLWVAESEDGEMYLKNV